MKLLAVAGTMSLTLTVAAASNQPPALEALRHEMSVAREVIPTALANTAERVRVVDAEAIYLAGQGVLIDMDMAHRPASRVGDFEVTAIDQIPHVVQEIVANVQLAIAPYEPEDLAELRELREEQRAIRNQQRDLRQELRRLRAKQARDPSLVSRFYDPDEGRIGIRFGDECKDKDEIADCIREREAELAALDSEYEVLEQDIDAQYDFLRTLRQHEAQPPEPATGDITEAVASVACDYGGTLKSLPEDEHLTFRLRRGRESAFYVFRKEDLVACRRESIAAPELLARATIYHH